MAIVVSDTSAIAALYHLGLAELLETFFSEVFVPPAVAHELKNPLGRRPVVDVADFTFLTVRMPKNATQVASLRRKLDAGESEAIALAIEVSADWILIDELDGRHIATELGLKPMGVLGVLLRAKNAGLVQAVRPLITRLIEEIDFRVSPQLHDRVMKTAGE